MYTYAGELEATLYEPSDDQQHLTECLDQIPRFLFRTHSPKSSGETTDKFVSSTGAPNKYKDVLQQKRPMAKAMIKRHLTIWMPSDRDNLMSWTSSLLFALQHAIRREKTDTCPLSRPEDIKISILDTSKVPRGTFMPAVALLAAYAVESTMNFNHSYYCGEYLSQGRLVIPENAMTTTTLRDLDDHGLYRFYPLFNDEAQKLKLCKRVAELRKKFQQPQVPTSEEIQLAVALAEGCCANVRFRPVLFASLLSLKPRASMSPEILSEFSKCLWVWDANLVESSRTTSPEEVPEYSQFVKMMHDLEKCQGLIKGSDMAEAMSQLHISPLESNTKSTYGHTLDVELARNNHNLRPKTIPIEPSTQPPIKPCDKEKPLIRRQSYINDLIFSDTETEALEQITKYASNSGPCHECTNPISLYCLRKGCFLWCSMHVNMLDQQGRCAGSYKKARNVDVKCHVVPSVKIRQCKQ